MMTDPGAIRRATYLLWVARDLERIAERVVFLATGRLTETRASFY